ncbi:hypothetical protein D3C76_1431750 [compost metagenome]
MLSKILSLAMGTMVSRREDRIAQIYMADVIHMSTGTGSIPPGVKPSKYRKAATIGIICEVIRVSN